MQNVIAVCWVHYHLISRSRLFFMRAVVRWLHVATVYRKVWLDTDDNGLVATEAVSQRQSYSGQKRSAGRESYRVQDTWDRKVHGHTVCYIH